MNNVYFLENIKHKVAHAMHMNMDIKSIINIDYMYLYDML